ncbi:SapC family protein [Sphingobium nicotianae]|uniref:SapC family protein n=1 Tax=Sphingobium nicotianae TaxID=2782607 RepID=A0A9X1DBN6_9SPHN|nr:SapC family protein [Sphingobium nicotianae]MBT2186905.1 SapC family protein [Sphingobium nicotianae]
MASAPQTQTLPMLYNDLVPLNVEMHSNFKVRVENKAPYIVGVHAVPLTIEEFAPCQRFMPIVFSAGDNPVPLALMGLNEGANTLVDAEGKLHREDGYVPAYVRRYPWMLVRLDPEKDEMSLCFDPTCDMIGEFEEGEPLIADGEATQMTKDLLQFCEQFEESAARTNMFMTELKETGLLMDGELSIQIPESNDPFVYRGFLMVNEEKLRELRGDQLRKMMQNGMLPLLYAHLFSLQNMTDIFNRQRAQGLGPVPAFQIS